MDGFFIGTAISAVDSGGRVVLPPRFMETLGPGSLNGGIVLGMHEEGQCLVACDGAFFAEQLENIDWHPGVLMGGTRTSHDSWLRTTFSFAEQSNIIDADRLSIGPIMRARGHIGGAVLLVGAGRRFEIWDLADVVEHGPYDLQWAAERHLQTMDKVHPSHALAKLCGTATAAVSIRPPIDLASAFSIAPVKLTTPHKLGH